MLALLSLVIGCSGGKRESSSKAAQKDSGGMQFSSAKIRKADSAVKKIMRNKNLPGVVGAVSSPGKEQYVFAGGKANPDTQTARLETESAWGHLVLCAANAPPATPKGPGRSSNSLAGFPGAARRRPTGGLLRSLQSLTIAYHSPARGSS